jgi:hypothetical protein
MMVDDVTDAPDLGPCCRCRATAGVVNILMLDRRAPVPGTGWGCVVCGLPSDGAIAVLCNACLGRRPVEVCHGYPAEGLRIGFEDLEPGAFEHDLTKHADDGQLG